MSNDVQYNNFKSYQNLLQGNWNIFVFMKVICPNAYFKSIYKQGQSQNYKLILKCWNKLSESFIAQLRDK